MGNTQTPHNAAERHSECIDHEYAISSPSHPKTPLTRFVGDVQADPAYSTVDRWTAPYGSGMSRFDATMAPVWAPSTDHMFSGMEFDNFLNNPFRAVDVTPPKERNDPCSRGMNVRDGQLCGRDVYLAGPPESSMVLRSGHPEADVMISRNQRGYYMRYARGQGHWTFRNSSCRTYGPDLGVMAFRLCVTNDENGTLNACKLLPSATLALADIPRQGPPFAPRN